MEIVTGLAVEAIKYTLGPIKRQVCYFFNHESKVQNLKNQVENLTAARDRVQESVDAALRNGELIFPDVEKWLSGVNKTTSEGLDELKADEDKANRRCFIELCPNLLSRYHLSKKAEAEANAVAELLSEGDKLMNKSISHLPDPQQIVSTFVTGFEAFESRRHILEGIKEALKDPNLQRIGVHGMSGVGKTMLVKEVALKARHENLFDEVVIATISNSRMTDIIHIQAQIAEAFGMKLEEVTEFGRATRLRQRLKNGRRILIVLDDIWKKIDLEAVGISFQEDQNDAADEATSETFMQNSEVAAAARYKLLLTSRSQDTLCNQMSTQKNFLVGTISEEEAMTLFTKIVGNKVEEDGYKSISTDVVKKCAGLPIAISVIANALRNMDLNVWEDALQKLKRSIPTDIEEMEDRVYAAVELSYNYLRSKVAQEIFLLCSLWPQGSDISISDLIKYSWGLGLLERVRTLDEARKRVNCSVLKLKGCGLLLANDTDGLVKLHDIVRDVSISIGLKDKHMLVVDDENHMEELLEKGKLKTCSVISMPYSGIHKLPSVLECPQLKLLSILSKDPFLKVSNFEETNQLKALNLTGMNLPSLPSSFSFLTNLQMLSLHQCKLGDIAIIGQLKKLEILSFVQSDIEQLPLELGQLSKLRFLDLSNCSRLEAIPKNLISSLCGLEELLMGNSFDGWGVESNASLTELKQLSHLIALEISIPNALMMPRNLFSEKLERYKIHIGDVWNDRYINDKTSAALKLKLKTNMNLDDGIQMLLKKSEDIYLDEVKRVENVISMLVGTGISQLKNLCIENCSELQHVTDSLHGISYAVFPTLESLSLLNLINLEIIHGGPLEAGSFNKLRVIKVNSCRKMRNLLSSSMARALHQLQDIEVSECENIIEIVENKEEDINDKLEFCSLRLLKITDLPNLITFHCERVRNLKSEQEYIGAKTEVSSQSNLLFNSKDALPCLEELELRSIIIHRVWDNTSSFPSPNLTRLIIQCCSYLRNLFSSRMATSLQQLKRLEVKDCQSITEIVTTDYEMEDDEISFPNLEFLSLKHLPKLTRFCGNPIKLFSLKELCLRTCPVLVSFVYNIVSGETSTQGEAERNESNENLPSNSAPLFDEKVALPKLERLEIIEIGSLRIWGKQLDLESFNNLNDFKVFGCHGLLNIFPITMLGRLQRLSMLSIERCSSVEEIFKCEEPNLSHGNQPVAKLEISSLTLIGFYRLPKLNRFFHEIIECPSLRRMGIVSCSRVELLFASDYLSFQKAHEDEEKWQQPLFWVNEITFRNLEDMMLLNNENLKEIWRAQEKLSSQCFPNLKVLKYDFLTKNHHIERERLLNCFWSFPRLEKLQVLGSSFAKEIFGDEVLVGETEFVLPNTQLRKLKLSDLVELRCLWNDKFEPLEPLFQELTTLKVDSCRKLKNLVPSSKSFPNLVTLDISKCDRLINLLTHSIAKSFVHLTKMRVVDCERMKGIIAEDEEKDVIVFTQLRNLEISSLPSLQSFCLSIAPIEFPSLDKLIMTGCPQLKIFCQGAFSTPKLQKIQLLQAKDEERHRVIDNDLNNIIRELYREKVGIVGLNYLDFSKFPELVEVWNNNFPQKIMDFQNFEKMTLCNCKSNSLRYLLTPSMALCLVSLQVMKIKNCNTIEQVVSDANAKEAKTYSKIIFPRLESISLKSCSNLTSFCLGSYAFECPTLKRLKIEDCPKMVTFLKELVDDDINQSYWHGKGMIEAFFSNKVIFSSLAVLILSSINIQKIWQDDILSISYYVDNLYSVTIRNCHNLKYVMSSSMVKNFLELWELIICDCEIMEAIVVTTEGMKEEERMGNILFPSLTSLALDGLPNLTSFYSSSASALFDQKNALPRLEELELRSIIIHRIWDNTASFPSENLTRLIIQCCSNLRNLFSSRMARSLQQLKGLGVKECQSITEIVTTDYEMEDDEISFPNLELLSLEHLPKLTRFCGNPIMLFSLKELSLKSCPVLVSFVYNIVSGETSTQGEAERNESNENLPSNSSPLFDEKVALPKLERLEIIEIGSLRIWGEQLDLESFNNLNDFKVFGCHGLLYIFPITMLGRLQRLSMLSIEECSSVEEIFECEEPNLSHGNQPVAKLEISSLTQIAFYGLPKLNRFFRETIECSSLRRMGIGSCSGVELLFASDYLSFQKAQEDEEEWQQPLFWINEITFRNLEDLMLMGNENLKEIWRAQEKLSSQCFPNLKVLNYDFLTKNHHIGRDRLLNCFWSFPSLEKLQVIGSFAKEICGDEALVGETQFDLPNTQLRKLKLSDLVELRCLWNDKYEPLEPLFQELTTLKVDSCRKLMNLVPSSKSFPNLVTLDISKCDRLINLLTHSIAKSFVHLTKLRVADCERIKGIIAEDEAKDVIVFTQLRNLEINSLPSLQSFCLSTAPIEFPSLDELIMTGCPQLKIFCQGPFSTPKLQKVQLLQANDEERHRVIDSDLNNTIRELYQEKVGFMGLNYLDFSKFPELVEVWNNNFPQKIMGFQNLEKMKLCNCKSNSLRYLLTPSMALCLVSLQVMKIKNCSMIEQVVADATAKEAKTYNNIILPLLESISLKSCSNLTCFCLGSYAFECPELKRLKIEDCSKMVTFSKEQVEDDINQSYRHGKGMIEAFFSNKAIFPSLTVLVLSSINIQKIWQDDLLSISYDVDNLHSVIIRSCPNLKYVMSSFIVKNLLELSELIICDCEIMEVVVATTEGMKEEERMGNILFPSLTSLALNGLPNLTSFYSSSASALFDQKVSFSGLAELKLSFLKKVKSIWDNQILIDSFDELKMVEVKYCEKLLSIFSLNTLATFQGVEVITIEGCLSLEVLVEVQGININEIHAMKDTKLKELHLINLPKLKHVWDKDFQGTISFKNLRLVHALRCWNLKNLFPISVAKAGLAQLEEIDISCCGVEEFFGNGRGEEEVTRFEFPKLTKLELSELPRLKSLYPGGKQTIFCPKLEKLQSFHSGKVKVFGTNQLYNVQERNVEDQLDLQYQKNPLVSIDEVALELKKLSLSNNDIAMLNTLQFPTSEIFQRITTLYVFCYHNESEAFPFCFLERFPNLEKLVVGCGKFKHLFQCEGHINDENCVGTVLSRIRHLQLFMLDDLRHIQNQNNGHSLNLKNLETLKVWFCDTLPSLAPSLASFPNLMKLDVRYCKEMENILAISTCQCLVRLKQMIISECYMVTEIVANHGVEESCEITFSKLELLALDCLPNLTSFCSGNYSFNFPSLKIVLVSGCPGLKIFSERVLSTPELESVHNGDKNHWAGDLNSTIQQLYTEKVGYKGLGYLDFSRFPELTDLWINMNPQEKLDFKSLQYLEVCNYNGLQYIFTPSMALGLVKLCSLKVKNCASIEHVITEEGFDGSALVKDVILLPLLESVSLESCPNLTSFYVLGRDALECLSLNKITVIDCPNMITFASSLFSERKKDKGHEASKEGPSSGKEVDGVCMKSFFTDKVQLPSLVHLKLSSVNIPKIWEDSKLLTMSSCVQHLTELIVESCGNLKYLFPSPMVKSCAQLETLEIRDSKLMAGVILDDIQRSQDHSEPSSSENHLVFPSMRELVIENCLSLETFITNTLNRADETVTNTLPLLDEKVSFPSLERLKLRNIGPKVVWHGQYPVAKSLVQLRISDCGMIREVMTCAPNEVIGGGIVFHQLKYLELSCLPNLESFSSAQCAFGFPSLVEVTVQDCPNIKTFSRGKVSTPKLKRLQLTESKDEELFEGNLNTTIQDFFAKKSKGT